MAYVFCTINDAGEVTLNDEVVKNSDDIIRVLNENDSDCFYCSSSIDFPEEYTDNEETIRFCREIRS